MPFWELAPRLQAFSFTVGDGFGGSGEGSQECFEAALTADEQQLPVWRDEHFRIDKQDCERYHIAAGYRTLFAAARGGQLRRLHLPYALHDSFAVRALLLYWVHIEDWDHRWSTPWMSAAMALRPLLAHASLWLGTATASGPRSDRHLTMQEVRSLHSYFKDQRIPDFTNAPKNAIAPTETIDRYLPWLAEDGPLAQEVAQAWSDVVEKGEAGKVKCLCGMCATLAPAL